MRGGIRGVCRLALVWLAMGSVGCGDDDAPGDSPPTEAVRFFVVGDTGTGEEQQYAVAAMMKDVCDAEGCDFAVLLGDNIYEDGVDGVDDEQWQTKFELPYAELDFPFFAVLGNHDYGGNILSVDIPGAGNEWFKGPVEVEYAGVSDKWVMDDTHYTFTWGNVGFIMLDSNAILWDEDMFGDQRDWYPTALSEVGGADWVFVAMHHPLRSQGTHGNAGRYESIEVGGEEIALPVPILDGANVRSFMDEVVCGTVDIAFAGHDHNRQWLNEADRCEGTELIVSGAGGKLTDFVETRGNDLFWGDDTQGGAMYVVVEGNTMTGRWYGEDGTMEYERTLVH